MLEVLVGFEGNAKYLGYAAPGFAGETPIISRSLPVDAVDGCSCAAAIVSRAFKWRATPKASTIPSRDTNGGKVARQKL